MNSREYYSTYHSLVEGNLCYFQFLEIINKTAIIIHAQVFVVVVNVSFTLTYLNVGGDYHPRSVIIKIRLQSQVKCRYVSLFALLYPSSFMT